MLDLSHAESVSESQWQAADAHTKLPLRTARYFCEYKGPMPQHAGSRRSFQRFYVRAKAVLIHGERSYGIYTTDISRQGIGFLTPRQLLPDEKCTLTLPNGAAHELQIKRCRRESDDCFACGARFTR